MAIRQRRRTLGLLAVLAVVFGSIAGLWALQRRLIYFPDKDTPSVEVMGAGWENVGLKTSDGLTLGAWYHEPESNQPVVLVFSGNAGNRAARASIGAGLAARGMGVLLTDYRGYGGNPGHPSEDGLAHDSRAALAFLNQHAADNPLVYFGESLGAAVAIELESEHPPAALVLRSPFTSLTDIGRHHYPWLPVGLLLKDRYPSEERIGSVRTPTLVIAGAADSIVPPSQSRDIFAAASEPKELFVISGADHNDPSVVSGSEMIDQVVAFIDQAISG